MFRAARQNRIFQDVVGQIQEAIVQGKLKAGDMLPAERELKEIFSTSRGTLREALRVLEQKGLIEIKLGVGGGAMVKAVDTEQMSASLDMLIKFQRVSLRQLAEFREGVEGDVAALAAKHATREDIQRLKELLEEAGKYCEKGVSHWDGFIKVDEQIHLALSQVAGNPIYMSVIKMVHDNIHQYYDRFLPRKKQFLQHNFEDLRNIIAAVEKGLATEARRLAQRHVRRFNEYMKIAEQQEYSDDLEVTV